MKISLNWLSDFVNIDIPIEELEQKLSKQSTEVKQILKQEEKYRNIVVGKIIKLRKHKNADKLQVALIDIGKKTIQVVCSAKNIAEGQLVPVCLDSAIVPSTYKTKEEYTVKSMDFRGELSEGMMCSERELDLGDDHSGILILPNDLTVGAQISKALELNDIILDMDFQSNQGYCMSHVGIAREIAALLGERVKWEPSQIKLPENLAENELHIEIENEKLCPRYTGIIMEGIKIKPSPIWMQRRIKSAGMRPINNVVDVTNYILLELGQPMHAFDYDKLAKKDGVPTIIVRKSKEGEIIRSLDEKDHTLPEGVLLISDIEKPIAVAGIIGGENSEIDENTTKIVFESANFDAITLRKGARKLGIRTDAIARYEKNLDPNLTMIGLRKAVELLLEISEGHVASNVVDVYPKPIKPSYLTLTYEKTNRVLGIEIPKEQQIKNLELLGFDVEDQGEQMAVTVPTARRDVKRPIDLIEEIIRIYGYDNLPLEYPLVPQKPSPLSPKMKLIRKLENLMVGMGFYEIQSYSMIGNKAITNTNMEIGDHIRIINPQAPEKEYMRQSLLPSLLENLKENQKTDEKVKVFEIQKVFFKNPNYKEEERLTTYANEPQQISAVWSCHSHFANVEVSQSDKGDLSKSTVELGYYKVKGVVEAILEHLNIKNVRFEENDGSMRTSRAFHPTHSAIIRYHSCEDGDPITIGILGELDNKVKENFELAENPVGFELDIPTLLKLMPTQILFKQFSRFPIVSQDFSLIVDEKISFLEIVEVIAENNPKNLVRRVDAVDIYKGEGIPEGKKSITINLKFQAEDHTLEQVEIDNARQEILKTLEKKVGGRLR